MKSKLFVVLGVIALFILGGYFIYNWENYEDVYYTKVDNSKIKELDNDDMKYEYTLYSYNKEGKKKEVTFKTYKVLKDNAYLKLTIKIFGVHSWEEKTLEELPEKVQEKLK